MTEEEKVIVEEGKFDATAFKNSTSIVNDDPSPSAGASGNEPPAGDPPPPKKEESKIPPAGATSLELDEYWQDHIENMGEGYEVPEEIKTGKNKEGKPLTRKEKADLLRAEIWKATDTGDDDFVQEYKKLKGTENFDREQWIRSKAEQKKLDAMSDDEFLFAFNKAELGKSEKNPNGLDDDAIREDIEKMSAITKKRERQNIETAYKTLQEQRNASNQAKLKEEFDANVIKVNDKNTSLVTNYLKNIEGKSNIDGIELSEADLTQYKKDIPNMLKVEVKKDKDGREYAITEAQELLNDIFGDEEKSMTMLPLLWMIKNNKFRGYTSAVKEVVKKQIEKKLDPNLDEPPGSAIGSGDEFDPKKFKQATTINNF